MNETTPAAPSASHLRPVTSESPNDDMSIGQLTDRTPVGDPRGSFRSPEPFGFDGSVADFLEFFVLEELDDALLERVRRGYSDAFRRHAGRNDAHGGFPHEHTEDCEERIASLVDSTAPDAFEATGEAHNCWLAGRAIDPLCVRSLVRSLQI